MPLKSTIPNGFVGWCRLHPGLSNKELAGHYGVSEAVISKWKIKHGIAGSRGVDYDRIDALIADGLATKEIVRLTGCSKSAIDKRKRDTGHGSGRRYISQHTDDMTVAEPVKPTPEIIADLFEHKRKMVGKSKSWMLAHYIGGQAWRQTMEGVER